MKIKTINVDEYQLSYAHGYVRRGALLTIVSENGVVGIGDLAPLKERSAESFDQAVNQFKTVQSALSAVEWNEKTFLDQLSDYSLCPSLSYTLESALFSIFQPNFSCTLDVAALIMGNSIDELLAIARTRKSEGFKVAKLKISSLTIEQAYRVIHEVGQMFRLRIDANSKWSLEESVDLFSRFPDGYFEYVEDPVQSLKELEQFPFPMAIEEPLSKGIALDSVVTFPTLKALVYKPTVLGGYLVGKRLKQWTDQRGLQLVLSSSMESDVGHFHISATAARLGLKAPIGIGTYHYLNHHFGKYKMHYTNGKCIISPQIFENTRQL